MYKIRNGMFKAGNGSSCKNATYSYDRRLLALLENKILLFSRRAESNLVQRQNFNPNFLFCRQFW